VQLFRSLSWSGDWEELKAVYEVCSKDRVATSCIGKVEILIKGIETVLDGGGLYEIDMLVAQKCAILIRRPLWADGSGPSGEYRIADPGGVSYQFLISFLNVLKENGVQVVRYSCLPEWSDALIRHFGDREVTVRRLLEFSRKMGELERQVRATGLSLAEYVAVVNALFGKGSVLARQLLKSKFV
jgi:hypothetical protein